MDGDKKYYGCIYVLWINNKPYVGQSRVLDKDYLPTQRWKRHIKDSQILNMPVSKAIRQYGIEKKEVLEYISHIDKDNGNKLLNEAEINWVFKLNSRIEQFGGIGYNCAHPGGGYPCIPHTEEHKKYMSEIMKGRKRSEETKQKIRNVLKGKPLNDTIKKNMKIGKEEAYYKKIPEKLNEWNEFYKKNGHIPKSKTSNKIESNLYYWQITLMEKKRNNILRQDIIDILDNTDGWIWEYPDEFQEQFNKWKNIVNTYNQNNLVKIKPVTNEIKKSILWVGRIRSLKKNMSPNLTENQIEQLNKCPEWSWENTTNNNFTKNYERWVLIYNKYNRRPKNNSIDKEEIKAYNWQSTIRREFKNNEKRVTNKIINILNNTEGWLWKER
jgi:hypothetical protein